MLGLSKNSLKIYIASPYSAKTEGERRKNTKIVIDAALTLFQKGHFPYIPHFTRWVDKRAKETDVTMKWKGYVRWHKPWLEACDALLYLGSSKGADIELQIAKDLGKRIYYSTEEVPAVKNKEVIPV